MRKHLLACFFASLLTTTGCKTTATDDISSATKDAESYEHVGSDTWKVNCKRGWLHRGEPYAQVSASEVAEDMRNRANRRRPILCMERDENGGGGGGGGGHGEGFVDLDQCPRPEELANFDVIISPQAFGRDSARAAQLKLCNSWAIPFARFLRENADFKSFLEGDNDLETAYTIEVGDSIKLESYGLARVPWDFENKKASFIEEIGREFAFSPEFSGIKTNVSKSEMERVWGAPCFEESHGASGSPLAQIEERCQGKFILMACSNQQDQLKVAAAGRRRKVFKETGDNQFTTENGVNFYWNSAKSVGFFPIDQTFSQNSCDTTSGNSRLCWHANSGTLRSGYRCGDYSGSSASGYKRYVYSRN